MNTSSDQKDATYENAECDYYSAGTCQSCSLLGISPGSRLKIKNEHLYSILRNGNVYPSRIHNVVTLSRPWQSRHKIKMSVGGSVSAPIIGITRHDRTTHELVECSLSPTPLRELLRHLRSVIAKRNMVPYDIEARTGELKHVIIISTHDNSSGIIRFVLRSPDLIPTIRDEVQTLQKLFPWISVVSCNIQSLPAAILEGPDEIPLTENRFIREQLGSLPLYFSSQSFMQVTPSIAQQLYKTTATLAKEVKPKLLLDLFCGVGGFSLSAAPHCQSVLGIELSPQAIECAQLSAREQGLSHVHFISSDVDLYLQMRSDLVPDMVTVNPPRRGLSEATCAYLSGALPERIIYSSCNPETFCRDVRLLSADYELVELWPFDMFPMTHHWEVLGLLARRVR